MTDDREYFPGGFRLKKKHALEHLFGEHDFHGHRWVIGPWESEYNRILVECPHLGIRFRGNPAGREDRPLSIEDVLNPILTLHERGVA